MLDLRARVEECYITSMKGSPAKRSLEHKGGAQTAPPQTVAEVLSKHVVLEVESIDRMSDT